MTVIFPLPSAPPSLRIISEQFEYIEGDGEFVIDLAELPLSAPDPSDYTWYLNGEAITSDNRRTLGHPTYSTLRITRLDPTDLGNYSLRATNYLKNGSVIGSATGSFNLNVLCKYSVHDALGAKFEIYKMRLSLL